MQKQMTLKKEIEQGNIGTFDIISFKTPGSNFYDVVFMGLQDDELVVRRTDIQKGKLELGNRIIVNVNKVIKYQVGLLTQAKVELGKSIKDRKIPKEDSEYLGIKNIKKPTSKPKGDEGDKEGSEESDNK